MNTLIGNSIYPNFTGRYGVRELWMRGELPEVKYDIYGLPLRKKSCSREHIVPKSMHGSSDNSNIALADKYVNSLRGTQKLSQFTTFENVVNYFIQFMGIKIKKNNKVVFDGNKYIDSLIPSLRKEGFHELDELA